MNVLINITYQGQSGNYLVNMDAGVDDATIKNICEEAVRSGEVPGISAALPQNAFANFVIDRFDGNQPRFVVRPKVPFGFRNRQSVERCSVPAWPKAGTPTLLRSHAPTLSRSAA